MQENTHSTLKLFLIISQIMGYFPVQGLSENNSQFLKFSWFSFKTIYSLLLLLFSVFVTLLIIICRLTDQVLYIEVAISGKRFFTVRKKAILTIAGIVATYQLVLKQLNTQIIPKLMLVLI
ncbi:uncharacterized protein LOC135145919 [Zophobas morio]|uniref:uncharacterized protein LOC135145919 n=1 Tax=Zophobas morio TaxID=2755281 RepID=UPI0030836572